MDRRHFGKLVHAEKAGGRVQSFSAAGNPYITTDTGAFFVRKGKQWFWNGEFDKGVDDLGYRELYTRWLQFGAFLPMFRSHGTDTPREPWRFGEPGTPFYDAIIGTIDLRYRLLPYLYSLDGKVSLHERGVPAPGGLRLPERSEDPRPQDAIPRRQRVDGRPRAQPLEYGPNSAPIADAAKTVDVYLPEGSAWVDFWTGQPEAGGRTIKADAPLSHIPLVRESRLDPAARAARAIRQREARRPHRAARLSRSQRRLHLLRRCRRRLGL